VSSVCTAFQCWLLHWLAGCYMCFGSCIGRDDIASSVLMSSVCAVSAVHHVVTAYGSIWQHMAAYGSTEAEPLRPTSELLPLRAAAPQSCCPAHMTLTLTVEYLISAFLPADSSTTAACSWLVSYAGAVHPSR
jgi:hypothetical protein